MFDSTYQSLNNLTFHHTHGKTQKQNQEEEEEVKEQVKEKKQLPPIQSNLSQETIHGVILNSIVNCKNAESSANMEVKKISSSNLIKSQNTVTLQKPVYHLLISESNVFPVTPNIGAL